MADPVVHLTNGVPDSGTGNITTLGAVVTALGTPMQASGGSVTANAGTNLNTSALALETGGNLAAAASVLGVTTGAAVTTSATGTIQQYLRGIVSLLVSGITVATHAVTQSGSWVLSAGSALIGKVGIDQTTDGTTNKVAADLRLAGVAADKGAGTGGSNTLRVIPDSSTTIAKGTSGTPATDVLTVQGATGMTPLRNVAAVSATASGATPSRVNAAASTNATNLKASAGQLYTIDVFNVAAYNVFLKFYNKASSPTVGTDTPIMTIPIQAGGGYSKTWPFGKTFATGISYAITKLQADSDTTSVAAGDLTGSLDWI